MMISQLPPPLPLNQSTLKPMEIRKYFYRYLRKAAGLCCAECHSTFLQVPRSSEITFSYFFYLFKIWLLLTWKIQDVVYFIINKNLSKII